MEGTLTSWIYNFGQNMLDSTLGALNENDNEYAKDRKIKKKKSSAKRG